jgi:hypothetical protein
MCDRQPDLFSFHALRRERLPPEVARCRAIAPAMLGDRELIAATPTARLADAPALAAEAGRRRLAPAVAALERLCDRFTAFGADRPVPEQIAALEALATIGGSEMTLDGAEFIRRFLIHVLPDRFHRIRYYGFLGNCHRARKLERCRELLRMAPAAPAQPPGDYRERFEALTGRSLRQCPHCHVGTMVVIDSIMRPAVCLPLPDTS